MAATSGSRADRRLSICGRCGDRLSARKGWEDAPVALKDRLAQFGLSLHEGKTRLVEFGRFAARNRQAAGLRRPETFDFLGFTHYCSETRGGRFTVKRKTQAKRMARKLKALREEMAHRMHTPIWEQHRWLCQVTARSLPVLRGHLQLSIAACIQRLRPQAMAKDTRCTKPEGPHDLGVFQENSGHLPTPGTGNPSGLA